MRLKRKQVFELAIVWLESEDIYLFAIEALITVGFLASCIIAWFLRTKFPKQSSKGWIWISLGLFSIAIHGVFDALDTLKWDVESLKDWLNFFDGLFFVLGILLIAIGIYWIAKLGAKKWGN